MANGARLTTSRYVKPGVYIGQLIRPRPGNLSADARVCNYIGRGSELAVGRNLGVRRSFVFEEELILPDSAPFEHTLKYPANGVKENPIRVYDSITGIELLESQWDFVKVGDEFKKVIISPETFDKNAVYRIDYQSTSREVQDPLPVQDLRQVLRVGLTQDREQFKDFSDFFIPYTFTGPVADEDNNSKTESSLTAIIRDSGNSGPSGNKVETTGAYLHDYNRFYELEVVSVSGTSGTFTATFKWKAKRYSGGQESMPPVPLDSAGTAPTFTVDETNSASLVQTIEFGAQVEFDFSSGSNFSVGDRFYFNGVGPGLVEFDSRYFNTNQFAEVSDVDQLQQQVGSTGELLRSPKTNYTGDFNLKYRFEVISVSGTAPNRTATFIYAVYGDIIGPTGQFTINEGGDAGLIYGIWLDADFGSNQFVVGDVFEIEALAPREFYQAKDDRNIKLTISSVTFPGADESIVTGSYSTGTKEGGFGSWEASTNLLQGPSAETGQFIIRDNITYYLRNAIQGNINGASVANGDVFESSIVSNEVVDWSLTDEVEETRETTAILTDVTGEVTGTAGTPYVVLSNVYKSGTVSVADEDDNPISYVEIAGTRFLALITTPSSAITISYEYRGEEPAPGQLYFMTLTTLRPQEFFNSPQLILERAEGRNFLAPSTADNHLYIMNELAFANGAPGIYVTQPKDADGDGILVETDVREALIAHEGISRATDLCLLSFFDNLSDALAVNETANDPFEKREQMLWVGAPIGTPIGDIDTPGSLVFLARNTLQVSPQSAAQGTRVLLAPTECQVTVEAENGQAIQVTLDGSFVAGATSALVNSFADPSETILRQNLAGFDSIQTYSEPEDLILGQASITYMSDQGNSVFRFEEDITVHTIAEEFQLINATTQKQFVTRVVRREMDQALISLVPPSTEAGIAAIRATLGGILLGLLGRGLIAQYQNDNGTSREFDPDTDIVVYRDTESLTLYFFAYTYFIKAQIKRIFGLFTVNTNDLNALV